MLLISPTISAPTPVITGLSPASGPVGTEIQIVGTGLTGATAATIGSTPLTGLVVDSDILARATVPTGATSGQISITTPTGTAVSPVQFVVTAAPVDLSGASDGQLLRRVSGIVGGVDVGTGLEIVSGALRWIVQRLDQLAVPTNPVDFGGQKAVGLGTPTASTDAATKNYVDTADAATLTSAQNYADGLLAVVRAARLFFAGPVSGAAASPTWRQIVATDLGLSPDSTKFLRGDMTWTTPAGGGGGALQVKRSNSRIPIGMSNCTALTTLTPANEVLTLIPFMLAEAKTVTGISVEAASNASTNLRALIYSNGRATNPENNWPETILANSGVINIAATAFHSLAFPSSVNLLAGVIYWAALVRTGATSATLRALPIAGVAASLGYVSGLPTTALVLGSTPTPGNYNSSTPFTLSTNIIPMLALEY